MGEITGTSLPDFVSFVICAIIFQASAGATRQLFKLIAIKRRNIIMSYS
jgi:hypothetical protein